MDKLIRPILVTGSHRSGTTWVGKTIATSPKVAYINEPFSPFTYKSYRGRCNAKFDYWHTYITEKNEYHYYDKLKDTLNFNYAFKAQMGISRSLTNFKFALKEQTQFLMHKWRNQIPLLKDPLAVLSACWIAQRFNARVIVLIRHPAAFCHSLKRLGWGYNFSELLNQPLLMQEWLAPFEKEIIYHSESNTDIVERACLIWNIIYFIVSKYKEQYPSWIYKRYEDLALDPIVEYQALFQDLGLPFDASVAQYIEEFTSKQNPTTVAEKHWAFGKRDSVGNAQAWKNFFSLQEINLIRTRVEAISSNFYGHEDW